MKPEISRTRRTPELELRNGIKGDLSIEQVVQVFLILLLEEGSMIPCCRITVERIDIASLLLAFLHEVRLHLDPCLFCQYRDCLSEIDLLHFHEKSYRSASLPTGEAVTDILLGRDDE